MGNVLIFEKRGGADAFENDPPFMSKGTVLCVYTQPCVYTAVDLNLDLPGTAVDLLHAVPGCTLEYFPARLPGY